MAVWSFVQPVAAGLIYRCTQCTHALFNYQGAAWLRTAADIAEVVLVIQCAGGLPSSWLGSNLAFRNLQHLDLANNRLVRHLRHSHDVQTSVTLAVCTKASSSHARFLSLGESRCCFCVSPLKYALPLLLVMDV